MATFDIPNHYLAAAPVIITSPTTRCGTTLVQRLLSASDNAFIYGEEIGNQLTSLTTLFSTQIAYCEKNGAELDESFHRALGGRLDEWRPGLAPPPAVTMRGWMDTYYQIPTTLSRFGEDIGRPIWGFKWPACSYETIKAFLTLMPRAKVVYVVRELADALKSAKARKFVRTEAEVARFCAEWAVNMRAFAALGQDRRFLLIRYETLISHREEEIEALSAFTGAVNIRSVEFDRKLNTFVGEEADGHSPHGYIAPDELTDWDRAQVRAQAGGAIA